MIFTLIGAAGLMLQTPSDAHSLLTPSAEKLSQAWERGYGDAPSSKRLNYLLGAVTRPLGRASRLRLEHPLLRAYRAGIQAPKKRALVGKATAREEAVKEIFANRGRIQFHGEVEIGPRSYRPRVGFRADPKDLRGFKVELIVGGRSFPPTQQPGDLPGRKREEYVWGHYVNGEGMLVAYQYKEEWFEAEFEVEFELNDPDGKPRITSADREVTVVVSGGFGTYKADYRLDALLAVQ